ncbi:MAG: anhydro-N-acetylmuramic acid kinase [Alphaproteobacteria bacterium]|nr:anhydro-N-acetylmuramic acid kinase [Alphaproteobacteria bacterium]
MVTKVFRAIGMISGTSIDGIDTALMETDGREYVEPLAFMSHSYDPEFREHLRGCFGKKEGAANPQVAAFERELTQLHAELVHKFLIENLLTPDAIDFIGFHGQTIWHKPEAGETVQIGDGDLLAELTGIPVINDFRSADVAAGGHGAPLVPLYHRALAAELPKPTAIVNIGGVSNITWIGGEADDQMLAFDMGPGNALIDDWVFRHTGKPYDEFGQLAAEGKVNEELVAEFERHLFFEEKPPKSLDRDCFKGFMPKEDVSLKDGAATLTLLTAWAISQGMKFLPEKPRTIYLTGGGRHNVTMMRWIEQLTGLPVGSVDDLGWSGDGLEAEAFAYLAARSFLKLPLSLPGTTGVSRPVTGGIYHRA